MGVDKFRSTGGTKQRNHSSDTNITNLSFDYTPDIEMDNEHNTKGRIRETELSDTSSAPRDTTFETRETSLADSMITDLNSNSIISRVSQNNKSCRGSRTSMKMLGKNVMLPKNVSEFRLSNEFQFFINNIFKQLDEDNDGHL